MTNDHNRRNIMNDEVRIYQELAPELQQALDDNGISVDDILRGIRG
jgi:hypothetical protein